MELTLQQLALWSGSLMAIITLLTWFYRLINNPIQRLEHMINDLNQSLIQLDHTNAFIHRDLKDAQKERQELTKRIQQQQLQLDELTLTTHTLTNHYKEKTPWLSTHSLP